MKEFLGKLWVESKSLPISTLNGAVERDLVVVFLALGRFCCFIKMHTLRHSDNFTHLDMRQQIIFGVLAFTLRAQ